MSLTYEVCAQTAIHVLDGAATQVDLENACLALYDARFIPLVLGGFFIGVFAVVVGGSMFFSVPFLQWFFPGVTFGAIVGNIKISSFFRGLGSTFSTRHLIEYRGDLLVVVIAFVGTVIGASLIARLDQKWLFPAIILAIILSEAAPLLAMKITPRVFAFASFLTGFYSGIFGAGIGIILIALIRLRHPRDTEIASVKIQARFVELILTLSAVATHWYHGNLRLPIWLPLSIGALLGGVAGGLLLTRMTALSGRIQSYVLRVAYVIALASASLYFFA
jgi:uncharacterized membrane protein YfcA